MSGGGLKDSLGVRELLHRILLVIPWQSRELLRKWLRHRWADDRQVLGPHLIQQNDVWSLKNGAGNGHSLLFTTT